MHGHGGAMRAVALRGTAFNAHLFGDGAGTDSNLKQPRRIVPAMPSASEGEARGDGAPTGAGPFLDAARLSPHSRLSARRPGPACAIRDFVWRRSHLGAGPRFASMRLDLRMASASSWQGSVVTPGGAPTPPGCKLAKLARGRRTSLHSHDASRERPSVSEVKWGICFYSYDVKGRS